MAGGYRSPPVARPRDGVERPDGVPRWRSRIRPRSWGGASSPSILDALLVLVPDDPARHRQLRVHRRRRPRRRAAEQYCDDLRWTRTDGVCSTPRTSTTASTSATTTTSTAPGFYWISSFLLLVVLQGLTGWTPGKLIIGHPRHPRGRRPAGHRQGARALVALDRRRLPVRHPGAHRLHRGAQHAGPPAHRRHGRPHLRGEARRRRHADHDRGQRPAHRRRGGRQRGGARVGAPADAPPVPPPAGARPSIRPSAGPAPPAPAAPAAPVARRPRDRSGTRPAAPTSSGTRRRGSGCSGTRASRPGP